MKINVDIIYKILVHLLAKKEARFFGKYSLTLIR